LCAVCHENDSGYIRACRVCGVRAHESCGGPGPMHRKCDKYAALLPPLPPPSLLSFHLVISTASQPMSLPNPFLLPSPCDHPTSDV
jgi:hypothetical protein